MSAFGHTLLGTYALIGFTVTGLSFLRTWVEGWYEGSLSRLKKECDRLRQTVNRQDQQLAGLRDLVARTQAERDRQAAELERLRSELERLSADYTDLQAHQNALEAALDSSQQQVQELQAEVASHQAENEHLRDTCDRQRAELEAAYQQSEAMEEAYHQQSAALATLQRVHTEQETQLQSCHAHLQERNTVIATLEHALEVLHQQQDQARLSARFWAWTSGVMILACGVMGLGPWSPLRPVWDAIYPHLPMFY